MMSKLRLWKPHKDHDYYLSDKISQEITDMGGTGVFVHKYAGPNQGEDETDIQDPIFMENRSRNYDSTIYELTGHYSPEDSDFDLTQFGLFLSSDTVFINFHLNNMVERLGRKLMAGDVLELPHLREYFFINDEDHDPINRFYVVEDGSRYSGGYGPNWWPHLWRVKAGPISDSEAYRDILGDGTKTNDDLDTLLGERDDIKDDQSTKRRDEKITQAIIDEAECDVPYDTRYMEAQHLYIFKDEETELPVIHWGTGDGIPPNGEPLKGTGNEFPEDMQDGEYFLRTDFNPSALFIKDGCQYIRVEYDIRKEWSGANKLLDTFINNTTITTFDDGQKDDERQALSKVVAPKKKDSE